MKLKSLLTKTLVAFLLLGSFSWSLHKNLFFPSLERDNKVSNLIISNNKEKEKVTALGRIEPKDKIFTLSGSSSLQFARVRQILVEEGENVKRGQVVAILDNLEQLQAAFKQAKQEVELARSRLARVKAGEAKQGEIVAQQATIAKLQAEFQGELAIQKAKFARLKADFFRQTEAHKATIARLEAEWKNAKTECWRYETLYQKGAISISDRDSKCLVAEINKNQLLEARANKNKNVETYLQEFNQEQALLNKILSTFPQQIKQAKATLAKLQEVREVDVQVAQAELKKALAAVVKADADIALAYVKAPVDGQILKIHSFPGESISSNQGIIDLGQTQQMYIIAEVYETDIRKISKGQSVRISSSVLNQELQGTVEKIGLQVGKKELLNNDPSLAIDARVIEVRIRLAPESSKIASKFNNLQVEVKFI